jgi:hypothetical protein
MIVPDPEKAAEVLKTNDFSVQTTRVVLLKAPNKPGTLAKALQILSDENIFIEYLYAFSMNQDSAVIVIRPSEIERCVEVLNTHNNLW